MSSSLCFANTNLLWGSFLVETLVRLGLQCAVISPGSRSTPLTYALAMHPAIDAIPVLDERSASFLALGVARRSGRPVVLVCTSGTAAANFYPAVIEGREGRVPLLLLTADRPPEMRDCHSGQAIDQQKLYGSYPNAYAELALPAANLSHLRYLRQTMVHLWSRCLGPVSGPVHVNVPFADPLAPVADATVDALRESADVGALLETVTPVQPARCTLQSGTCEPWLRDWKQSSRGVIVAGTAQPNDPEAYARAVTRLAGFLGWPVLADGLSPLRNFADQFVTPLITAYDLILREDAAAAQLRPETVLRLGPLPTSKVLRGWLEANGASSCILGSGDRNLDPLHGATSHLPIAVEDLAAGLQDPGPRSLSSYAELWKEREAEGRRGLDEAMAGREGFFEGKIPWLLSRELPEGSSVFVSNSMPVRDVEFFWKPNSRRYRLFCNRGANGIDGTLSSALGICHRNAPSFLLTGDLALLHDTNGFLLQPHIEGGLTILLSNNNGGGIFENLPIAKFDPPFEKFFATPQEVDFSRLASAYAVSFERLESWERLISIIRNPARRGIHLVEIPTDRKKDSAFRRELFRRKLSALALRAMAQPSDEGELRTN